MSGDGSYQSPAFTPTQEGTYSWVALYSGDTNNAAVQTACNDPAETVTVGARQSQRLPVGRERRRHLRLRAELQRLAGQQPPQCAHRRHRQRAGCQRIRHGRRRRRGLCTWWGQLLRIARRPVIPSPIAAIAAPPNENGYWLAAQNGKIYNYGGAPALPAVQLPPGAHIEGMASTTDGQGAWLVDQLGDVYAEGSAQYVGGLGGKTLNTPVVGIAAAANGQGYVLVAADGGAFNYGTQHFFGSVPGSLKAGQHLVALIVGIAVTHSGNGYWMVGKDGGVFNYGDAPFLGSTYTALHPGQPLNAPIAGIQHLGSATG